MTSVQPFLLGVALLMIGASSALAQTEPLEQPLPEEKTVGDWRGYENAWQHARALASREAGSWAWTGALNGREGGIGINTCGRYNVHFSLQAATVWFEGEASEDGVRIIYGNVIPSETVMRPVMVTQGDMHYFSFDADRMVAANKLLLCPTEKKIRIASPSA